MAYALASLPVSDALLKNAAFVNFSERESADFSQVEYFVERQSVKMTNSMLYIIILAT